MTAMPPPPGFSFNTLVKRWWVVRSPLVGRSIRFQAYDFEPSEQGVAFFTELDPDGNPMGFDIFFSHPVAVMPEDIAGRPAGWPSDDEADRP